MGVHSSVMAQSPLCLIRKGIKKEVNHDKVNIIGGNQK